MTPPADDRSAFLQDGTRLLLGTVDRLTDEDLDAPSALADWDRRRLLAHLGFNAEALRRLASWARTGERTPMYASPEQRNGEIAEGATWPAPRLRAFVADTAAALAADLAALPEEAWRREVVTAQGRTVPASELPWMRTREVAVHAVDLDAGVSFADLPAGFCAALVADVAALRSTRGDGPALELHAPDGGTWQVQGTGEPIRVRGASCALARWLTGRGAADLTDEQGRPAPRLGPWL